MPEITIEDWKAQIDGTLTAIVLACTSMIASHPEKTKILALLENLASKHSAEDSSDNSQTKHYKLGIREAVSTVAYGVSSVQFATMPTVGDNH
jgi:hypothetical protein